MTSFVNEHQSQQERKHLSSESRLTQVGIFGAYRVTFKQELAMQHRCHMSVITMTIIMQEAMTRMMQLIHLAF